MKMKLEQIRIDGGTQSRAALDQSIVDEYRDAIADGAVFPPVVVFYDGSDYWLADGFHRYHAHESVIDVVIHQGSQRDAVLYSVGANSSHGLRRTNADKRRAVETLLRDPEWCQWSDREIARRAGVSDKTVSAIRATAEIPQLPQRIGADGKTRRVKHWSDSDNEAQTFFATAADYDLSRSDALGAICPGAKKLSDVSLSKQDTYNALRTIAIQRNSDRYPVGSYVERTDGRVGIVKGLNAGWLDVFDPNLEMVAIWVLSTCKPATDSQWQKYIDSIKRTPIEAEFAPGEEVEIVVKCSLATSDVHGRYSPSTRELLPGTRMQFVASWQQGKHLWSECNWAGSPTVVPMHAIGRPQPQPETPAAPLRAHELPTYEAHVWGLCGIKPQYRLAADPSTGTLYNFYDAVHTNHKFGGKYVLLAKLSDSRYMARGESARTLAQYLPYSGDGDTYIFEGVTGTLLHSHGLVGLYYMIGGNGTVSEISRLSRMTPPTATDSDNGYHPTRPLKNAAATYYQKIFDNLVSLVMTGEQQTDQYGDVAEQLQRIREFLAAFEVETA